MRMRRERQQQVAQTKVIVAQLALAQMYLAGWADAHATVLIAGPLRFERTRFFNHLRRMYRDHYDYLMVVKPDEKEREFWLGGQIDSFLGIPPEVR